MAPGHSSYGRGANEESRRGGVPSPARMARVWAVGKHSARLSGQYRFRLRRTRLTAYSRRRRTAWKLFFDTKGRGAQRARPINGYGWRRRAGPARPTNNQGIKVRARRARLQFGAYRLSIILMDVVWQAGYDQRGSLIIA